MGVARAKINWNIELAATYSCYATSSNEILADKYGFWVHMRHTPKGFPIDFVALARYSKTISHNITIAPETSFTDYGLSLSKQGEDFDLQFEYVNRTDNELKDTYDRVALIANYRIAKGIVAVASIGKDFDEVRNVFSAFGVKFGLGTQKSQ